jgi:aminoglycoside/choline kinase family phosphotransferase
MRIPSDDEVRKGLEFALAAEGLQLLEIVERRASEYWTSFPIELLRVTIEGREPVTLVFKQLDHEALGANARLAKPRFLHNPLREPVVYRWMLSEGPPGPPQFFGAVLEADRHWLFIEWVEGRELFQVGERELWEAAARWLARFHDEMSPRLLFHRDTGQLVEHDAHFYRQWMERAQMFGYDPRREGSQAAIEWLAARHEPVVEALLAMPKTLIHGEFYASNVLVADGTVSVRVAPVDWELAAAAPGLTDLAALVSGWDDSGREAMVVAYASERSKERFTAADFDFVRLQVAIQRLGWAPPEWERPEGQRHDWQSEAVALAEGLGL